MTEVRKIKTFKDTNYFSNGTYKRQFRDYMYEIGLTNIVVRTILAPVQRWRIIRQTQTAYPLRPLVFNNAFDYVKRIPKEQGFSSFWRGNMAGLCLYMTQSILQIGMYDNLKALQRDLTLQQQKGSIFTLITQRLFIPIITTFFTQVITYPVDTARVRITMNFAKQKSKFPFTGIRTCLNHLRQQQSFAAMYKGFLLSNMISLLNFNLYLAFASAVTQIELGEDSKHFINGDTISAVLALLLVHPLDTLKKIIQLDNMSSPSIINNGRSAINYIKRQSSLGALYRGLTASVFKSLMFLPTFYLAQSALEQGRNRIQF